MTKWQRKKEEKRYLIENEKVSYLVFFYMKVCIYFRSGGYKCTGNVTEWTKCQYITKIPSRKAFKVPKEYHDVDVL